MEALTSSAVLAAPSRNVLSDAVPTASPRPWNVVAGFLPSNSLRMTTTEEAFADVE